MTHTPQTTLIVIPGFKGSQLFDRNSGRMRWLTAREALFGSASLTLAQNGSEAASRELQSGDILDRVPVFPGFGIDVYGKFIAWLRHESGAATEVVTFGYDWRLAPAAIAAQLATVVEQHSHGGTRPVHLIGHSMGALIAAYYLRCGSQTPDATSTWSGLRHVGKAAFITACFAGTAKMFRVLQMGDPVGRNRDLLSAHALQSFASSYSLLPDKSDFVVDAHAQPITDDPLRAETWSKYGWGGLADGDQLPAAQSNLESQLQKRATLMEMLHIPEKTPPESELDLLNITAAGKKTLARVILDNDGSLVLNAKQRSQHAHLKHISLSQDGDGTLTAASMQVPEPFLNVAQAHRQINVQAEHMGVLHHPHVRSHLRDFLFR